MTLREGQRAWTGQWPWNPRVLVQLQPNTSAWPEDEHRPIPSTPARPRCYKLSHWKSQTQETKTFTPTCTHSILVTYFLISIYTVLLFHFDTVFTTCLLIICSTFCSSSSSLSSSLTVPSLSSSPSTTTHYEFCGAGITDFWQWLHLKQKHWWMPLCTMTTTGAKEVNLRLISHYSTRFIWLFFS